MENNLSLGAHSLLDLITVILQMLFSVAISHSIDIEKKQESSRKTSALLTMQKPLTVWIATNWKILKEMGIPGYLSCLLRNLYAGQEATIRTSHGTTDWFRGERSIYFSRWNFSRPLTLGAGVSFWLVAFWVTIQERIWNSNIRLYIVTLLI